MIRAALLAGLAAAPAMADLAVLPCDPELVSARAIPEPWPDFSAAYAQGAVRLAVLDRIEPAAAAVYLLVLSPPHDEIGERQCRVVAPGEHFGFMDLDFAARRAEYDPAAGLRVTMPAARYEPEQPDGVWSELALTINQSSGEITARLTR
ncbi:MAG: hypothetical protein Q4G36_05710 [Paracoccus sp. (in: a-proteobacteria)]|nr:hypothetical protein [Paracoccus sp. (in: a-proteobacteria)]